MQIKKCKVFRQSCLVLALGVVWLLPERSFAIDYCASIDGDLRVANVYVGYPMPTRETLFAHAPFRRRHLLRRAPFSDWRSKYCRQDLEHLERGFRAIYPEAPDHIEHISSWNIHVVMEHFTDLKLCSIRHQLRETLTEIERRGLAIAPCRHRINALTFDYSKLDREPKPVQRLRWLTKDLFWMAYKGYAPAMLELAKLGARDDVVRLTPRFAYYLLRVSNLARLRDPAVARLLGIVRHHLSPDDRAEIDARAEQRHWPLAERMVID